MMSVLRIRSASTRLLATAIVMIVGALALSGCRGSRDTAEPRAVPLTVHVTGADDLNGGGNAAFVHVYQLADDAGFRNAPPESFWQAPDQALGSSMLSTSQVQLFPGEDETITVGLGSDTRYVGVAANLRDPDRDRWRAVFPAAELAGKSIHVTVDSNGLSAALQ
ncbi:MAG TPA: type VI secretion system lipoprotein TssJ [Rhodothermales bacterium]